MHIEADADPRYRQVTFTWPDDDNCAAAVLLRLGTVAAKAREDGDLSSMLMKLDEDGEWRLTLRLRADFRSPYQFCPWPQPVLGTEIDDDTWLKLLAAGVADPSNPVRFGAIFGNPGPSSILELPDAHPASLGCSGVPKHPPAR